MSESWRDNLGLHDLGNGCFAYLQSGSWGWSNAGLITDSGVSLLVDTLFDFPLTREMLRVMSDACPDAREIDVLANTHANADHTFGNGLVKDAEIIASKACALEIDDTPPEMLAAMMRAAPDMGQAGAYLQSIFGAFDFEDAGVAPPTRTFEGELTIMIGDKEVRLIEVGPAHTKGDILVHVPAEGIVYAGDILFIDGTPLMWAGPVANWIKACDLIQQMDARAIVPGHGPITDIHGVERLKEYLAYIDTEARLRFDAGLSVMDAVHDIALHDFDSWGDAERIVANVDTLYREYRGEDTSKPDIPGLFALMAQIAK